MWHEMFSKLIDEGFGTETPCHLRPGYVNLLQTLYHHLSPQRIPSSAALGMGTYSHHDEWRPG